MIEISVAVEGKGMLLEIVSMLVGLIRSNSPSHDVWSVTMGGRGRQGIRIRIRIRIKMKILFTG